MVTKLIRQINNLRIFQDKHRPVKEEFYVKSPDGRILEAYPKLSLAVAWAKETFDFTNNRKKTKTTLRDVNKLLKDKGAAHNTEATRQGKDYYLLHICGNGRPSPLFKTQDVNELMDEVAAGRF